MRSSQQQKAIDAVIESIACAKKNGPRHIILEAVAGAGKTHTLLEIIHEVYLRQPDARVLLLAFNSEMSQTECN